MDNEFLLQCLLCTDMILFCRLLRRFNLGRYLKSPDDSRQFSALSETFDFDGSL